jgi:hypothetical protein
MGIFYTKFKVKRHWEISQKLIKCRLVETDTGIKPVEGRFVFYPSPVFKFIAFLLNCGPVNHYGADRVVNILAEVR